MDEQANLAALPRQDHDWHLITVPRSVKGEARELPLPEDTEMWVVVDPTEGAVREMGLVKVASRLDHLLRLVIDAVAEPRPPCTPARPRRLYIPNAPHELRSVELTAATRAALTWSLQALGVEAVSNTELAEIQAMSAAFQAMHESMAGLLTGAPFHERALCQALHRLDAAAFWQTPAILLELSRLDADAPPPAYGVIGVGRGEARNLVCYQSLRRAFEMQQRAKQRGDDEVFDAFDAVLITLEAVPAELTQAQREALRASGVLSEDGARLPRFRRFSPQRAAPGCVLDRHRCEGVRALLEGLLAFLAVYPPATLNDEDAELPERLVVDFEVDGARMRLSEILLERLEALEQEAEREAEGSADAKTPGDAHATPPPRDDADAPDAVATLEATDANTDAQHDAEVSDG